MNKFIKLLIESVDDDFFSDLGYDTEKEVTFLVDDKLYPDNVIVLGNSILQKDIENIVHIGAILSNDNGCWLLWNLNNEYWDPYGTDNIDHTNKFGEIVGVCVGKGMFAKVGWTGLTNRYKWANKNDLIYQFMHEINIDGSGYDSTMNIINNYSEYIKDTVWEHLVEELTNEYLLYLPNKIELKTIYNIIGNTNIYKLLRLTTNDYWTSSLCADSDRDYYNTFIISFNDGVIYYTSKACRNCSVALLHF